MSSTMRCITPCAALEQRQQAGTVSLHTVRGEHSLLDQLQNAMPTLKEKLRKDGHQPVLTVTPQLRPLLASYARVFNPGLHTLPQEEIPEMSV
ncbi:flagellar biosynthesis component FlhA [Pseudomonas fluorescens]|nr:flagellar biosynthesis component FlhA [Pseudomonas fluorescens]